MLRVSNFWWALGSYGTGCTSTGWLVTAGWLRTPAAAQPRRSRTAFCIPPASLSFLTTNCDEQVSYG